MSKRNGTRRAWTSEQVRTLKTLARKKTPAGKIARALKRTEGATRQKLLASDCLWNRAFKIKLARPNAGLFYCSPVSLTSALDQQRTWRQVRAMAALPSK